MALKDSDWEFVTSGGGSVTVGFISGGGGLYQIHDSISGNTMEIDYLMLGGGFGLSVKPVQDATLKLLKTAKSLGGSASLTSFPNAGVIFETSLAPKGAPLEMFTDGVFAILNGNAAFGVDFSGSLFVWFRDGLPFVSAISAIGVFFGTGLAIPGAGVTLNVARAFSTSFV